MLRPLLLALIPASLACADTVSFNRHVRPILADKCFACHGFDAKKRKAGLRLDVAEGAFAEKDGVRAIVPGKVEESDAWRRILSADPEEVMPPPETHKTLSETERVTLKRWIEQGAPYQKHWSFEAPVKAPLPRQVALPQAKAGQAIDAFIGARLDAEGLRGSPEADKPTLIRRVAFTLTGLPPTPSEVDAFLVDSSPDAYEKMVERYFESPRHGEEMARHWLDVARYADTHGLHLDNERQMWAYRDWVVRAFNANKPFDQFSAEQLAGDLIPNASPDQLVATGFNRCNVTSSEGGSIDAEYLYRYAVDRASTTAQAWMGLTAGCATCHDHKFDPLSTKEFYSLYAFFNSAADPAMDGNNLLTAPVMKLNRPDDSRRIAELDAAIAAKKTELAEAAAKLDYTDPATAEPKPPATEMETVWLDDDFPAGAKVISGGHALKWRTAAQGAKVFSGQRAVKRNQEGVSQDFYHEGAAPLPLPLQAEIFVHVHLDPANPPKAVMVQFHHQGDWLHRAVWGDYDAIEFGRPGTTERVHMGPLPELGKWARLAVPVEKIGLKPGDAITGFAMTQHGGTVFWDKFGVKGLGDPSNDSTRSFRAWWKSLAGTEAKDLPESLRALAKRGPEGTAEAELEKQLRSHYLANVCVDTKATVAPLAAEIEALRKKRQEAENGIPSTFIFRDLDKPRESFVMMRGQYDKPGEKVEPGTPAILPPLRKASPRANRMDLAKWLFEPEHPLTGRVAVNRLWQQVFGVGLVKTGGDFGSQGQPPSHPELLDWLSVDFRENGWDVRRLLRLMLTSAAFRQDGAATSDLIARDPENRLLARGPRMRLQAEQVRDNALFVSGLLNAEMGGVGVKPYQPPNVWEPVGFAGSNTQFYRQDKGGALYRRSLYTFLKRTAPPPFMANFDAPNREQICVARERSNTPMQALQLMNDVQHVEAARALAQRMLTEGGDDRIGFAFRVVLSRPPSAEERAILEKQLETHRARYTQDAEAAKKLISQGESKPKADLRPDELAAHTLVASALLNLDETITRN